MTRADDGCNLMKVGSKHHVTAIVEEIQICQCSQHSKMSWQQSCVQMTMLVKTGICCNSYYWLFNGLSLHISLSSLSIYGICF